MWKVKMCSFTIPCIVCQWQQWFSNNAVFFLLLLLRDYADCKRLTKAHWHGQAPWAPTFKGFMEKKCWFQYSQYIYGPLYSAVEMPHIFWLWLRGAMFREWVWIFKNVSGKHLDNIMLSGLRLYLPCYLRIVFVFVFLEKCMPLTSW